MVKALFRKHETPKHLASIFHLFHLEYILSDNELVKDSYTSSETAPTGRKSPYYGFDFDHPDIDRGDYIFVPKDAAVHSYACIDDDLRDRQYSSDHCPVLAIVTLK